MKRFICMLIPLLSLLSCQRNRRAVDVSNIPVTLNFFRFEKDLFNLDTLHLDSQVKGLKLKYPDFYPLFVGNILQTSKISEGSATLLLKNFVTNHDLKLLKKDCDSVYPNLSALEIPLKNAFQHYRYYYPKAALPHIITFISGFNNAIVNTDSDLAIGLDMFLGKNYRFYRSVQFPRYLTRTLQSNYLPVQAMKGFAKQIFPDTAKAPNLLREMIYEGKVLYFLDAMLPDVDDTIKISYTAEQMRWCKENESNIWAHSLEDNKLFSSEKTVYQNFFSEGPFTPDLGAQSAPRLGMWVGWQIVRKYMDSHPDISLRALMASADASVILKESGYRPN